MPLHDTVDLGWDQEGDQGREKRGTRQEAKHFGQDGANLGLEVEPRI